MTVPQKVGHVTSVARLDIWLKLVLSRRRKCQGPFGRKSQRSGTKQVIGNTVISEMSKREESLDPLKYLYSDTDEEDHVSMVRVNDRGSRPQYVDVQLQGVPATGVIDTGADITIMGGTLFKKIVSVAKLRKSQFKKADKRPHTYDRKQFSLDGRLDLDLTFGEKMMTTPVYLKMDAVDQLLLSEGVCSQLGMVNYHVDVHPGLPQRSETATEAATNAQTEKQHEQGMVEAHVPQVRVNLLRSLSIPPRRAAVVEVQVAEWNSKQPLDLLFLEGDPRVEEETGLQVEDTILSPNKDGVAKLSVWNPSGFTQTIQQGKELGIIHLDCTEATPGADGEVLSESGSDNEMPTSKSDEEIVGRVSTNVDEDRDRKVKLLQLLEDPET